MVQDTLHALTDKTWVDFALVVWKDVWGYMASTGIGLIIGVLLPQLKLKNLLPKGTQPE
jgi:hypothetical protein